MGRVAVLGEQAAVAGYALAGALVLPADGAAEVRAAWQSLPGDVEVVILTERAARLLGETAARSLRPLTVVFPP